MLLSSLLKKSTHFSKILLTYLSVELTSKFTTLINSLVLTSVITLALSIVG